MTFESGCRGVFCDFDGTLVQSLPALKNALKRLFQQNHLEWSDSLFDRFNGPTFSEIARQVVSEFKLKKNSEELYGDYKNILREAYKTVIADPDAEHLLSSFSKQGKKVILVTSNLKEIVMPFLKQKKWEKYFSDFAFGDEVKSSKPSPDIFRLALKKAGTGPTDSFAIEDSKNGVIAALGAGLSVCWLKPPESDFREWSPNPKVRIVNSLKEIVT